MIWNAGYHSGVPAGSLNRQVVGAIAQPLPLALLDFAPVSAARKAGLGVVLPTECWRNQLPEKHPKRASAFSTLQVNRRGLLYDPDCAPLRGSAAAAYAADDQADQIEAGATLILTPGHVLAVECADGRRSELLLAQLAAEEFVDGQRWRPAPGMSAGRDLFASIVLQGEHAAVPWIISRLVEFYAELENLSGYWIVAANTNRSARQMAGYLRLALTLEAATGRPTVLSRVGDEHLAALAEGVAATCVGLHAMTFKFPPEIIRDEDVETDEEDKGIGLYTYFPPVLGNAGALGREGDALRARLFGAYGCNCGHHPEHLAPAGKTQIARHNAWAIAEDAATFGLCSVREAEHRLDTRIEAARERRARFEMSRLRPGFAGIIREAQRIRSAEAAGES